MDDKDDVTVTCKIPRSWLVEVGHPNERAAGQPSPAEVREYLGESVYRAAVIKSSEDHDAP